MKKQVQITQQGYDSLKVQLDELVDEKRPKAVERLARARDEGDLSENNDYKNAREELEFLDGRIDELKEVISNAKVIKTPIKGDGAVIGTKVTLRLNGQEVVFEIVGEWEADPVNKKISHESPLGKALAGRKVGEEVEVEAPAGKIKYEVVSID